MALTVESADGQLTTTSYADVIAAPAANRERIVRNVIFHNAGVAAIGITLAKKHDSDYRVIWDWNKIIIPPKETLIFDDVVNLTDTDHSLRAKLSGAGTVDFTAAYVEKS